MSSRLSVPVSKFTRSISSTPSIARPSHLLAINGSRTAAAVAAGRKRQARIGVVNGDAAAAENVVADVSHDTTTITTTVPLYDGGTSL